MTKMSSSEKRAGSYHQRMLFRSTQSDEVLPHQHRSSIVERLDEHALQNRPLLTQALLESYPDSLKSATETLFLRLAGAGRITKVQLSRWLSQDRLYAETYICFITSLIARVSLPYAYVSEKSKSLRWRLIKLLTGALNNIHRELEFFTSTAQKYDLDLNCKDNEEAETFMPNYATQQYMDLFRSFFVDPVSPLMEGMVILWATEQCYLSAWTYASQFTEADNHDQDGGALREAFIPNWTSNEFKKFVDEIAELTNLLADREQAGKKLEVYKAVWSHVLDIEQRFWPEITESAPPAT
jgi:thiaminase